MKNSNLTLDNYLLDLAIITVALLKYDQLIRQPPSGSSLDDY